MSAVCEVKIRLNPTIKRQFDQLCRAAGTTMTSEISHLISSAIDKSTEQAEAEAEAEAEAANAPPMRAETHGAATEEPAAAPPPPMTDILVERLNNLLTWMDKTHAEHPRDWFEQWFKLRSVPELSALAKQQAAHAQFHANASTALTSLQNSIGRVERNTKLVELRYYQDYKIWTAVACGALALVLILALLPGEAGLSRFVARKIIGGKNDVHAAGIMAGGSSFAGQLIYETSALMKAEPFANNYAKCVERAKHAKKATRCTLTFPALVQ